MKLLQLRASSLKRSPKISKYLREVLFVVRAGSDIIKPDSTQNKRSTFSTKAKIGIKVESFKKFPEIINSL